MDRRGLGRARDPRAARPIALAPGDDPELERAIRDALAGRRCLFVAGIPGAGKSLVVARAAAAAVAVGRRAHLLQWDVARLPFDTPSILDRYPEVDGVTHAAIRLAVGRWARAAVERWDAGHPDPADVLIGETPLVGERLMSLARPASDGAEGLLAGPATLFVIPVPSVPVRRAIEEARAREMASPRRPRDTHSAPPHLVRLQWEAVVAIAEALGVPVRAGGAYDPDTYAATYRILLRHRHSRVLPLERVLPVTGSVHGAPAHTTEIVPTADEVAAYIGEQLARGDDEIAREAAAWRDAVSGG